MRRNLLVAACAAALSLSPLASASAQWGLGNNVLYCGGNDFNFCFEVTTAQVSSDFIVKLYNVNPSAPYSSLSFFAAGFTIAPTAPTIDNGPGVNMTYSSDLTSLSGAGGPSGPYQGAHKSGAAANGVGVGGTEYVQFTFANTTAASWSANSVLGVHAGSGPRECSSKMYVNVSSGAVTDNVDAAAYQDCGSPISTVPEPSTYVLLASGLAAVGIIARRRRPVA